MTVQAMPMNDDDDLFADEADLDEADVILDQPWKVLVVDDEEKVHAATRIALRHVIFEQRKIELLNALSGAQAKQILSQENDLALVLLDVVMSTDTEGLEVVKYIRDELKNKIVRIVLRTGQPGEVPEESVIVHYDINDYKTKAELTTTHLFTTVVAALRGYRDLQNLDRSRQNLHHLNASLEHQVHVRTVALNDRNAQLELKQQEVEAASKAKSLFLANMSHELRTPLTAIVGYAELIQDDVLEHEAVSVQDLEHIMDSAQHLLAMINEILDIAKVESGKITLEPGRFNLDHEIQSIISIVQPLSEQKHNQLSLVCAQLLGEVHLDQGRVRQILLNLLSNACKFTENGVISLHTDVYTDDRQPWIKMTVSDTGIGIAPDQQNRVFKEFCQAEVSIGRRYGGTGLGLCISQQLARLMGGDIKLHSILGEGSRFTLLLPTTIPTCAC